MTLRAFSLFVVTLLLIFLGISSLQAEPAVGATDSRYCPDNPRNMTRNPTMDGGHGTRYGFVADEWEPFIFEGEAPQFTLVSNEEQIREDKGGIVQFFDAAHKFDAGIYQTVTGLVPNVYYSFYVGQALAARDLGNGVNVRDGDPIGRQIGVDVTGDTDPHSPNVIWGPQFWNDVPSLYIDEMKLVFAARTDRATLFVRAFNRNIQGLDKVWFDIVCLVPRDDLPTATPVAPTATYATVAILKRVIINPPSATPIPTDTPTPTLTSTPTSTPTLTPTPTETPRVHHAIPTAFQATLTPRTWNSDTTQVLGGVGVFAIGGAIVMLFSGGVIWIKGR